MAWDGNGVFTGLHDWVQDRINSIKILATRHKDQDDVFIAGINACLAKNGENAATGNIDMGSNRLTLLADGTAHTDAVNFGQIQDGDGVYFTSTGSANAFVLTPAPAITAYTAGMEFKVNANFSNTGAATINVSTIGAKAIKKTGGVALTSGDMQSGNIYTIVYDGTNFEIQSPTDNVDVQGTLGVNGIADFSGVITGGQTDYNVQTGTTYTLVGTDEGKVVTLNNGSAITLTLPQNSTEALPEGFSCIIRQLGAGQVTVAKEGSDTLQSSSSATKLTAQFSEAQVDVQTAGTPNTWFMAGDISV